LNTAINTPVEKVKTLLRASGDKQAGKEISAHELRPKYRLQPRVLTKKEQSTSSGLDREREREHFEERQSNKGRSNKEHQSSDKGSKSNVRRSPSSIQKFAPQSNTKLEKLLQLANSSSNAKQPKSTDEYLLRTKLKSKQQNQQQQDREIQINSPLGKQKVYYCAQAVPPQLMKHKKEVVSKSSKSIPGAHSVPISLQLNYAKNIAKAAKAKRSKKKDKNNGKETCINHNTDKKSLTDGFKNYKNGKVTKVGKKKFEDQCSSTEERKGSSILNEERDRSDKRRFNHRQKHELTDSMCNDSLSSDGEQVRDAFELSIMRKLHLKREAEKQDAARKIQKKMKEWFAKVRSQRRKSETIQVSHQLKKKKKPSEIAATPPETHHDLYKNISLSKATKKTPNRIQAPTSSLLHPEPQEPIQRVQTPSKTGQILGTVLEPALDTSPVHQLDFRENIHSSDGNLYQPLKENSLASQSLQGSFKGDSPQLMPRKAIPTLDTLPWNKLAKDEYLKWGQVATALQSIERRLGQSGANDVQEMLRQLGHFAESSKKTLRDVYLANESALSIQASETRSNKDKGGSSCFERKVAIKGPRAPILSDKLSQELSDPGFKRISTEAIADSPIASRRALSSKRSSREIEKWVDPPAGGFIPIEKNVM
jgi:hypothetical protein